MPNIEKVKQLINSKLPDVYGIFESIEEVDGKEKAVRYSINLKTGEVYYKKQRQKQIMMNAFILPKMDKGNYRPYTIGAYDCAYDIGGEVIIARWIFAPSWETKHFDMWNYFYKGNAPLCGAELDSKYQGDAICRLDIAPPILAEMFYITKDKEIYEWEDQNVLINRYPHGHYKLAHKVSNQSGLRRVDNIITAMRSAFHYGFVGHNEYCALLTHQEISSFLHAKNLAVPNNKGQREIEQLTSKELPKHEIEDCRTGCSICFVDRLDQDMVVLRWYLIYDKNKTVEVKRLYVSKDNHKFCRIDKNGVWVYFGAKLKPLSFMADEVILASEDVFDGTKLEYFKNIYKNMPNKSAGLYMLTIYPEFEQYYKSGLAWMCNLYLRDEAQFDVAWDAYVNSFFGKTFPKEKNLYAKLGVNKHQMTRLNEFLESTEETGSHMDVRLKYTGGRATYYQLAYMRIIATIKEAMGKEKLNDIDDATFDTIVELFEKCKPCSYMSLLSLLSDLFKLYPQTAISYVKDMLNIDLEQHRADYSNVYWTRYSTPVNLFADILRMIDSGGYETRIKPHFKSSDELSNIHDIIVDLYNAEEKEIARRKEAAYTNNFKKRSLLWKKWEYEGDDFIVIAPKEPVDIAEEGITLSHCVRSYIPSLANGTTNIMFIRRKEHPDKPFFTVEITNDNSIRQIHGSCNRNVNTEPGLEDFVAHWAKMRKIKNAKNYNGIYAAR